MIMAKKNKAVLITGGSRRLGLELARACLAMEYSVIVHYHTSPLPAKRTLARIDTTGKRCFYLQGDLREDPAQLIDRALKLPVKLEGLVNCASVFTEGNLTDPAHLESTVAVNTFAPVKLSQRFYESVKKGWIINITDANIAHPNRRFQNYRISKLFLETITTQQAFLYAPSVRVNAIAPGAMLPSHGSDTAYFKTLEKTIPLKRTGDMKSLTDALSFLIGASYITGQVLHVDGGWHLV
jgi:NAD(P)-dependent dehydrogenase (short-subunit alcohol dehydrogenase family)